MSYNQDTVYRGTIVTTNYRHLQARGLYFIQFDDSVDLKEIAKLWGKYDDKMFVNMPILKASGFPIPANEAMLVALDVSFQIRRNPDNGKLQATNVKLDARHFDSNGKPAYELKPANERRTSFTPLDANSKHINISGTVNTYLSDKEFIWITPDDNGPDVFFKLPYNHQLNIRPGITRLTFDRAFESRDEHLPVEKRRHYASHIYAFDGLDFTNPRAHINPTIAIGDSFAAVAHEISSSKNTSDNKPNPESPPPAMTHEPPYTVLGDVKLSSGTIVQIIRHTDGSPDFMLAPAERQPVKKALVRRKAGGARNDGPD